MRASDFRVLTKMEVRYSIFKLFLFQLFVAWCSAKYLSEADKILRVKSTANLEEDVQRSIDNIVHTGIYSHEHLDPAQAQVVFPVKVTRDGALASRVVDHAHEHGHARARRDLHMKEHHLEPMLHYNLTLDGRDLRLDLRPSVTFITPAMIVERHFADRHTRSKPDASATACHFTGIVRGQSSSSVALSACNGLAGLLRTAHGEYWIEPSNQLLTDDSQGRPHVVFKRSAVNKINALNRAKRAVDSTSDKNSSSRSQQYSQNANSRRLRDSKELTDRRRRERLEARRKRLMQDPKYRKQRLRHRLEQRRKQANSTLASSSTSSSSWELSKSAEKRNHTRTRNKLTKEQRRLNKLRRRSKRSKNCGTKQPPYMWKERNLIREQENRIPHRTHKNRRVYPHRHQLSHRVPFAEPRRAPRSVSKPRHVEVLLVADNSMTDFHDKSTLEIYLLTIMNMVSSLYMDPSIGNYIKVVVVKIILIEEFRAAQNLNVSTDANMTLSSFCQWQHQLNPDDDENPHHHDVAILVTRKDICGEEDKECSTLGVAHVGGMCSPDRSCSLNEDNGIMLAHTITHELGHNFGLYHDTNEIGCAAKDGKTMHIMTPIFIADTYQVAWSTCSKRDVTNFLDTGFGECLGDTPSQDEYVYPHDSPGEIFDTTMQCKLEFGSSAVACMDPKEFCERLWCTSNGICRTNLRPPAAGTSCGEGMWCQDRKCVARAPAPAPRDGGWGPWGAWSACSRSCGAGVSTQTRECNSPAPSYNGNYCIGERSRYKICNTQPCLLGEDNFRDIQCKNHTKGWVTYVHPDKPCELLCLSPKYTHSFKIGFVLDGTPCRQTEGARDMCIAGVCHKVGCDWEVDSELEEDECGVCGGNGTACKTVQGIYNKGTTKQTGFSEVAVIPAGSRNVNIKEKVNPGNYIFIVDANTKKRYINGSSRNQPMTEYFVAGSQAIYERDRDWEKVHIPGPITQDLRVYQHIYNGRNLNPVVTYKYTVDRAATRSYRLSGWGPCSVSCGNGVRRRHVQCIDEHARVVEQSQCYHLEAPRVVTTIEQCVQPECPRGTHWWVGAWNQCPRACRAPGEEPTKQRSVYCVDKATNSITVESRCDATTKPASSIKCSDLPPC